VLKTIIHLFDGDDAEGQLSNMKQTDMKSEKERMSEQEFLAFLEEEKRKLEDFQLREEARKEKKKFQYPL